MKRRSEEITGHKGSKNWVERTAARTMLRAVRFSDEDFDKPIIALAIPYTNGTPCNDHVRDLGDLVQREIEQAGGKAIVFGTPVVSDGISMGTEAMKYSLVSRDVIADSIELMTEGYRVDAVITLSGCDKTIPAALMPIARNNLIGLTLYGGSILPGDYHGKALNIVSAFEAIGAAMRDSGSLADVARLDGIGHRVVHGGEEFTQPTPIDAAVVERIRALGPLAPLHNPANLEGITVAMRVFPDVPQVAVFDTAFHQTLPRYAYTYAIDRDVAAELGIRRYGFHGTSHAFVSREAARLLEKDPADLRMVVLHLGNGASASAVSRGRCIDTSMGLTPLAGLVMGTRSGDIDPAVTFHLGGGRSLVFDDVRHFGALELFDRVRAMTWRLLNPK